MSISDRAAALGRRIALVRGHFRLTQRDFAEAVGVAPSYISAVENGKTRASIEMLMGIADAFDEFSRDWLLTGEGPVLRPNAGEAIEYRATHVDSGQPIAPTPTNLGSMQSQVVKAAADKLVEACGLGPITLLAEASYQEVAWQVLAVLSGAHPEWVDFDTVVTLVNEARGRTDHLEVVRGLLTLQDAGLVEESEGGALLRAISQRPELRAQGVTDIAQQVRSAIEMITQRIVPAVRAAQPRGYLVSTKFEVGPGESLDVLRAVGAAVRSIVDSPSTGKGEVVELILGGVSSQSYENTKGRKA